MSSNASFAVPAEQTSSAWSLRGFVSRVAAWFKGIDLRRPRNDEDDDIADERPAKRARREAPQSDMPCRFPGSSSDITITPGHEDNAGARPNVDSQPHIGHHQQNLPNSRRRKTNPASTPVIPSQLAPPPTPKSPLNVQNPAGKSRRARRLKRTQLQDEGQKRNSPSGNAYPNPNPSEDFGESCRTIGKKVYITTADGRRAALPGFCFFAGFECGRPCISTLPGCNLFEVANFVKKLDVRVQQNSFPAVERPIEKDVQPTTVGTIADREDVAFTTKEEISGSAVETGAETAISHDPIDGVSCAHQNPKTSAAGFVPTDEDLIAAFTKDIKAQLTVVPITPAQPQPEQTAQSTSSRAGAEDSPTGVEDSASTLAAIEDHETWEKQGEMMDGIELNPTIIVDFVPRCHSDTALQGLLPAPEVTDLVTASIPQPNQCSATEAPVNPFLASLRAPGSSMEHVTAPPISNCTSFITPFGTHSLPNEPDEMEVDIESVIRPTIQGPCSQEMEETANMEIDDVSEAHIHRLGDYGHNNARRRSPTPPARYYAPPPVQTTSRPPPSPRYYAQPPVQNTSRPPPPSRQPCRFFNGGRGYCRNGSRCRYSHELSDQYLPRPDRGHEPDRRRGSPVGPSYRRHPYGGPPLNDSYVGEGRRRSLTPPHAHPRAGRGRRRSPTPPHAHPIAGRGRERRQTPPDSDSLFIPETNTARRQVTRADSPALMFGGEGETDEVNFNVVGRDLRHSTRAATTRSRGVRASPPARRRASSDESDSEEEGEIRLPREDEHDSEEERARATRRAMFRPVDDLTFGDADELTFGDVGGERTGQNVTPAGADDDDEEL